ncbi:MAG: type II toxin-antitoxin system prevent-host-death family antitoxin [Bifidobacteriaceae bacterium]|jgi:prevent-host-death family protein|nr:type II toxin-antitoxin system prevent-host-death family antitoxin [Bifidobacteriaceae bacterium]
MQDPITVGIAQAHDRFSELAAHAEAGTQVVITRHGRPVLRLVPTGDSLPAPGDGRAVADVIGRQRESRPASRSTAEIETELHENRESWRP